MKSLLSNITAAVVLAVACGGCTKAVSDTPTSDTSADQSTEHGQHDEHHDHSHSLGPHGGHVVELQPADYQVEWLHDDESNLISAVILNQEGKEEVTIPVPEILMETVVDGVTVAYKLEPTNATEEDPPAASRFEITSAALLTALKIGTGVDAHVKFTVGETTYKGEIEHHDHSHGHSH